MIVALVALLVVVAVAQLGVSIWLLWHPPIAPPPTTGRWNDVVERLDRLLERRLEPALPPPAPAPSVGDGVMLVRFPSLQPIGARHPAHPDVEEALRTPGLALLHPNGRVEEGFQGEEEV